ncbi:Hypothetical_protein [Hexamita inflata]|uniref:Hypothetical_protein n=1 Tax=Hexamita inflata TaxID=28002 RepID=A0AA86UR19_9EUKA|nr:Hypothetical protein HINF_LOCUS55935 [Hexamita inflata]
MLQRYGSAYLFKNSVKSDVFYNHYNHQISWGFLSLDIVPIQLFYYPHFTCFLNLLVCVATDAQNLPVIQKISKNSYKDNFRCEQYYVQVLNQLRLSEEAIQSDNPRR